MGKKIIWMVNVFHWFMENVMSNIVGEFIFLVIGIVVANLKRIQLYIKSLIYFRQDVRFSMAYLYQIKIDDRYLLIKGFPSCLETWLCFLNLVPQKNHFVILWGRIYKKENRMFYKEIPCARWRSASNSISRLLRFGFSGFLRRYCFKLP